MPKILMMSTQRGSEDGLRVDTHTAGEVYDLCDDLAGVYVREGWGELVTTPPAVAEQPRVARAPKNRASTPARTKTPQKARTRR